MRQVNLMERVREIAGKPNTLEDSGIFNRILRRRGCLALGCQSRKRLANMEAIAKNVSKLAGSYVTALSFKSTSLRRE